MNVLNITASQVVDKIGDIASLPNIYFRLKDVVTDIRASNKDIALLISDDPALTARLLHIANSSFYGSPSEIDTITRAVTVIGTRQVTDIVLATSVTNMFEGIPQKYIDMTSFWRNSVCSGVVARVLASHRRESNIEKYFVIGLLHDIGRMVMCLAMGSDYAEIMDYANKNCITYSEAENHILQFDHADVGGALLEKWGLPQHMIDAVKYHNKPEKCNDLLIETSVVHVAEVISYAIGAIQGRSEDIPPLNELAWDSLSLPISIIMSVMKQSRQQFEDAVAFISPEKNDVKHVRTQH